MRAFFYEVREFFTALFERPKPRYVGFLRKSIVQDGKPSKGAKGQLGFRK